MGKPEFQSKRLNEIFNLTKRHQIRTDMTTRQILAWVNVLLKPCALVVRSVRGRHYRLDENIDIQALISRKNKLGKFYMDKDNLLTQSQPQTDLFIDEETGVVISKNQMNSNTYNTSLLDKGVEDDYI